MASILVVEELFAVSTERVLGSIVTITSEAITSSMLI
jgi:hypothetical protein